jgi:hypothetical protein
MRRKRNILGSIPANSFKATAIGWALSTWKHRSTKKVRYKLTGENAYEVPSWTVQVRGRFREKFLQ